MVGKSGGSPTPPASRETVVKLADDLYVRRHEASGAFRERIGSLAALLFGLSLLGLQIPSGEMKFVIGLLVCWVSLPVSILSSVLYPAVEANVFRAESVATSRIEKELTVNPALSMGKIGTTPQENKEILKWRGRRQMLGRISVVSFAVGLVVLAIFAGANVWPAWLT